MVSRCMTAMTAAWLCMCGGKGVLHARNCSEEATTVLQWQLWCSLLAAPRSNIINHNGRVLMAQALSLDTLSQIFYIDSAASDGCSHCSA